MPAPALCARNFEVGAAFGIMALVAAGPAPVAAVAGMPAPEEVISMGLADFAKMSFVWAGMDEADYHALAAVLGMTPEQADGLSPGLFVNATDEEFEYMLDEWQVAGNRLMAKLRARHGRSAMKFVMASAMEAAVPRAGRTGGADGEGAPQPVTPVLGSAGPPTVGGEGNPHVGLDPVDRDGE